MAVGGVAYAIHAPHYGIERSVVANGVVGTIEVIVDSSGDTNDRHVKLTGKHLGTCECAITTNHHKCIDAMLAHVVIGLLATLRSQKFFAACGTQNCAATMYDIRHILGMEVDDFILY